MDILMQVMQGCLLTVKIKGTFMANKGTFIVRLW